MHDPSPRLFIACTVLVALLTAPVHAQGTEEPTPPGQSPSLFPTLQQTDSLKTFVSTLRAAGLTDLLRQDGPFTVLAPTESAFAALPEDTFAPLLRPENQSALRALLKYHIVEGRITAADLRDRAALKTLQGSKIGVDTTATPVTLLDGTEATITTTNLPASNGVLHVIDTVLRPPETTAAKQK